ncbi:hypothetical protein, partial [Neisseria meningitidis]|uniref:hypothetical protein n=3 Tax=Neisseria meningitidis TaxID=487 RepID=UPI001C8517BD
ILRTEFFKNPTPAPSTAAPWSKRQTAEKQTPSVVLPFADEYGSTPMPPKPSKPPSTLPPPKPQSWQKR